MSPSPFWLALHMMELGLFYALGTFFVYCMFGVCVFDPCHIGEQHDMWSTKNAQGLINYSTPQNPIFWKRSSVAVPDRAATGLFSLILPTYI